MKSSPLINKMDQINSEIAVRSGRIAHMRLALKHDRDLEVQSLNKLAQFYNEEIMFKSQPLEELVNYMCDYFAADNIREEQGRSQPFRFDAFLDSEKGKNFRSYIDKYPEDTKKEIFELFESNNVMTFKEFPQFVVSLSRMMPNDLDKRVYADFAANHLSKQYLTDMIKSYKTSKDMIYETLNTIIEENPVLANKRNEQYNNILIRKGDYKDLSSYGNLSLGKDASYVVLYKLAKLEFKNAGSEMINLYNQVSKGRLAKDIDREFKINGVIFSHREILGDKRPAEKLRSQQELKNLTDEAKNEHYASVQRNEINNIKKRTDEMIEAVKKEASRISPNETAEKSKMDEALKNLTLLRKGRAKDNVEVLVYADHRSNGWNKLIEQLTYNPEQIEKAFDKTFSMPKVLHPEEKREKLEQLSMNIRGIQIGESSQYKDDALERVR
jgi:hypothetical protein